MADPALNPQTSQGMAAHGQLPELAFQLSKIRQSFVSRLVDRCLEIEALALNIDQTGVQPQLVEGIAQRAHKIAGVASTLGFAALGKLAERTDAAMTRVRTQDDWHASRALLEDLLNEIENILDSQADR